MEENIPAAAASIKSIPPDEFHIALTMAGAASAGCYTAGVMDYLFEIMDIWEKAKGPDGKLPEGWDPELLKLVPQHKVIIDAMGGTSAGGMTTVMSAIYALCGKLNPVSDPASPENKKNNLLYDSWVLMSDEPGKSKVLEKTFSTDDITGSGKIQSLLNSGFIDEICENAFKNDGQAGTKFPFIADDLELVLSHTMLRGIPLGVNFNTPVSRLRKNKTDVDHSSSDHFTISHFKLDYNEAIHKDRYLPLKPFDATAAKTLKLATMATGAFPVGLKFREFFSNELSSAYLKNTAEKIAFNRLSDIPVTDVPKLKFPDDFPAPCKFVSIDGGAINNEPFGEVLGILKERYGKKKPADPYQYALVMIDPFPDFPTKEVYKQPDDLFSVVPAIIGTLWDQSKVKRAELLDAYSGDYYRGQVFPVRWGELQKGEPHPIACGAAMAFGGLLDIRFRHHDFFLGRDNARNFFRTFFSLPCKVTVVKDDKGKKQITGIAECHPLHRNWTVEMVRKFKREATDDDNGTATDTNPSPVETILLPIIPDLYILKEIQDNGRERNPKQQTVAEWPLYDATGLFALQDKMKERAVKLLELSYEKAMSIEKAKEPPVTAEWTSKYYTSNWWKKFKSWLGGKMLRLVFKSNKGKLAGRMTKAAIEWILKDLEENKLLKKPGDG